MTSHEYEANYAIFRECLSSTIVSKFNEKPPKTSKRKANKARRNNPNKGQEKDLKNDPPEPGPSPMPTLRADPEELADFIDFIASETFPSLPPDLQTLTYASLQHDSTLSTRYPTPLPSSFSESLSTTLPLSVTESLSVYSFIPNSSDLPEFISRVLNEYVASVTTGPPVWASTRTDACEICERDWIPLSYHHLIPREVHAKVIKKGWHDEWMLNSVAWLCRACHSFVHRMATNEELAREWFTIGRIIEREDVQNWANWVGRVRWKAK